jgi:hypothetical protein
MSGETTRSCGTCTLCCKALHVEGIDKEPGEWCPHCAPGEGCGIYERRPPSCRSFNCLWLLGHLGDGDRPDRIGAVFWASPDNVRREPDGRTTPYTIVAERHDGAALAGDRARAIILDLLRRGVPVAIGHGTRFRVLGLLGQRIVVQREVQAQRPVGITVGGAAPGNGSGQAEADSADPAGSSSPG